MNLIETNFVRAALISALTTLYTVPTGKTALVRSVKVANTSSAQAKVRLYFVPNGETAVRGNAVLYDVPISGNSTGFDVVDYDILSAGDTIQASGGATLTLHISGALIS